MVLISSELPLLAMMSMRRAFQGGRQTLWTALETMTLAWLHNARSGLGCPEIDDRQGGGRREADGVDAAR
ncbi:hypothetical protein [Streptomyces sp. NPDC126514]|uniref:hypothetical protein n=1 Tax=Streptomyces sp. NPDC126514 TaxID=3155210 RepID=UPI00332C9FC3